MYATYSPKISVITSIIPKTLQTNKMDKNGIIYGNLNFMIPSHMNIGKMALDKMLKNKNKIALIDGSTGEQIRFGELVQLVVNTAASLMRLGVKRDEVVAVCSENRMEFVITAIAVWCSGASATFLNSAYSKNELVHSMNISKPKYTFLSHDTYKTYYDTMVSTNLVDKFFVYGDTINDPKIYKFNDLAKVHTDVDSFKPFTDYMYGLARTALILYSSGTTGLPKGAKLTHLNLITAGNQPCKISKDLITLMVAPWANTIGILNILNTLVHNRTLVFLSKFKEDQYLSCVQKYRAGFLLTVPPLIVLLIQSPNLNNYDLSSIEYMQCGGAHLDLAVIDEAKQRFPCLKQVLQGYGMTETTGALVEESDTDFRPGSVGRVFMGNIVKISDPETGRTLGPNQEGEMRVKSPVLFGGYIGRNLQDELDDDGFFKTGDICYYDKEGYFYFVDRLKELIKYKAGQVSPAEIEGILLQHPDVKDVAVTGKPDQLAGELPTAFVVKKPRSRVTEQELVDFVAPKVSSWKQLRGGVYFVEEIPKTPSGKILRRILRDNLKKPLSKL